MARTTRQAELGKLGERLAARFMQDQGFALLDSNWHCRSGEIDLVMRQGDDLVFVEVKARRGERAGRADDAVSPAKAHKVLASVEWYMDAHPDLADCLWRCDLVAITFVEHGPPVIRHYVNALVIG